MANQASKLEKVVKAPVHILFIIDQLCETGGAERALLKMVRLLPKDKFRCSLLTFKIDPSGIFANLPCPLHVFPLRRTYDLDAAKFALQLRRLLRSEGISVVHTFFETSDLWAGVVAKVCRVRVLLSSRRDMGILRSPKHAIAYKVVSRLYDAVLTVSDQVRKECIGRDHIAPGKVITVYNGVDLQQVAAAHDPAVTRAAFSIPDGSAVIATVGHVRKVKGFDILIRAAAAVRHEFPNAVFLVIGDVAEQDHYRELMELSRSLQLEDTVRFIGSSESIFSILKLCDVFYLPSRSEGFSNALVEAMACGLPCVATRVGGNEEAVVDGKTGFLVPSEEPGVAAEKITALLRDPAHARRMGRAGREQVESKFSDDAMMAQLVRLYDGLLEAKHA